MSRIPRLALASLLALALHPALAASDAAAKKSGPASPTPLPPIYDTEMLGTKELAWKKNVCYQSNRRLFINFGTNDCAPCRLVNHAMHEDKFMRAFLRQFVPSFIDVTPGSKNTELLKDYGIDPKKGLPAVVILDNEGKFLEATTDGELLGVAKQGDEAVRLWILKKFYKDSDFQ